uniref:Uncharacterized protein n=1 Tax=Spironucleus salmonicida TaxID=348837 RepID=V6M3N9_9EUKA|eukprot:EST47914.1 Hypothetical protein SS50377_12020 [Spironucleus salmonicida]
MLSGPPRALEEADAAAPGPLAPAAVPHPECKSCGVEAGRAFRNWHQRLGHPTQAQLTWRSRAGSLLTIPPVLSGQRREDSAGARADINYPAAASLQQYGQAPPHDSAQGPIAPRWRRVTPRIARIAPRTQKLSRKFDLISEKPTNLPIYLYPHRSGHTHICATIQKLMNI